MNERERMIVPYQSNKALHPMIQEYGCCFLSIIYIHAIETGDTFNETKTNALYQSALAMKAMNSECLVMWDTFLFMLNRSFRFVGFKEKEYLPLKNEREILKYKNDRTGLYHFVVGDGKSRVLFDSYSPYGSTTVREGYLTEKRIIRVGL